MLELLLLAAKVAMPTIDNDKRSFFLGAIGIRNDGAVVCSKNGACEFSTSIKEYQLQPNAHAEGRVLRKLGKNGIIFVARVSKRDGSLAMSRPCSMCRTRLKGFKVKKVYYTIDSLHYGIWDPKTDKDRIFECSYKGPSK